MASPSIHRIERWNYAIAAVAALASLLTRDRGIALGVVTGSGLTCLNFYLLRRLIVKWTNNAAAGDPGNAPLLMLPKMVGLMGAVALCVLLLPINVIGFVFGYSIFIVSIVIDTMYSALRPSADPASE